jgi:hypothetical protein
MLVLFMLLKSRSKAAAVWRRIFILRWRLARHDLEAILSEPLPSLILFGLLFAIFWPMVAVGQINVLPLCLCVLHVTPF